MDETAKLINEYREAAQRNVDKITQLTRDREALLAALKEIQRSLEIIVCDEDLSDEKLREHSESTIPNACDIATNAIIAAEAPAKEEKHG